MVKWVILELTWVKLIIYELTKVKWVILELTWVKWIVYELTKLIMLSLGHCGKHIGGNKAKSRSLCIC